MRLAVNTIPEEGEELAGPVAAAPLAARLLEDGCFRPLGDGSMQLRLAASEGIVTIDGQTTMAFAATCSRCAGPVQHTVAARVSHRLVTKAAALPGAADDVDVDIEGDSPVVSRLTGREVDLAALACEDLLVALPMRALCAVDCRGLCPSCGINRNLHACDCRDERTAVDPRLTPFAALQRSGRRKET